MAVALLLSVDVNALADRTEGDPHKMHHPQTPKLGGWDVSFENSKLGDDFKCTLDGPLREIHFWVSLRDNTPIPSAFSFNLSIYSNVPKDPDDNLDYSHPGQLLWGPRWVGPGDYKNCPNDSKRPGLAQPGKRCLHRR